MSMIKANWNAWVADWRSMLEHPTDTEIREAGLQSLEAAEEYLGFISEGPEDALDRLERDMALIEEASDQAFTHDDPLKRERAGGELYERIKNQKDELVLIGSALKKDSYPRRDSEPRIAELCERLIKVTETLLIRVFGMKPDDFREGLAEFFETLKGITDGK